MSLRQTTQSLLDAMVEVIEALPELNRALDSLAPIVSELIAPTVGKTLGLLTPIAVAIAPTYEAFAEYRARRKLERIAQYKKGGLSDELAVFLAIDSDLAVAAALAKLTQARSTPKPAGAAFGGRVPR